MVLLVAILIFGVVMLLAFASEARAGTLDLRIRNTVESGLGGSNAAERFDALYDEYRAVCEQRRRRGQRVPRWSDDWRR